MHDQSGLLARGVLLNSGARIFGFLGFLWLPLGAHLFGAQALGEYFLVLPVLDIVTTFLYSGASDAVLIFGSRYEKEGSGGEAVARAAIYFTIAASLLATIAFLVVGPYLSFVDRDLLRLGALAIPSMTATQLLLALSKTDLHMGAHAILTGAVRPSLFPFLMLLTFPFVKGGAGIVTAYVASQLLLGVIVLLTLIVKKPAALQPIRPGKTDFPRFLRFATPQTLNLTLGRYNARLDLLMLGTFRVDAALIALYGAMTWLNSELRTIRLTISGALMPVASRLGADGARDELSLLFNRASRWTTALVGGAVLGIWGLLPFILEALANSSPEPPSLLFAGVLLLASFVNCAWGLAGNVLIALERQKWTLLNALLVAALNSGANALLIPRLGLLGAALATAGSVLIVSGLQLFELAKLERISLRVSEVGPTYLALSIAGTFLVSVLLIQDAPSLPIRCGATLGALLLYLFLLRAFGIPELNRKRDRQPNLELGAGAKQA